jgi:hypothetical protein
MTDTQINELKPARKKAVNGRAKGAGFELTMAKLLSTTFAPLNFKRTQSSGAIVGGRNSWQTQLYSQHMLSAFVGDIFPVNEEDIAKAEGWKFRFTVECKFYQSQDAFATLFKNPQLLTWWAQAKRDAAKIPDREPLLICKFNFTDTYVGFECDPPKTVSRVVQIDDVKFCLMNEALKDLNWWKAKL